MDPFCCEIYFGLFFLTLEVKGILSISSFFSEFGSNFIKNRLEQTFFVIKSQTLSIIHEL